MSAHPLPARMTESMLKPPRAWHVLHGNALPLGLLLPLALLALWHVAAAAQWLPPQTLPAPREVLHTLLQLAGSGELFINLAISLRRLLLGLLLGSALGLLLGIGMGLSRRFDALLRVPLFAALQIPTLAWIPLLMLCFGIGEALKLVVIIKAVCIPMLTHARVGIRDVPPALLEVASINGLPAWQRWRLLYLPAATPALLSGRRLAVSDAWLSLLVVELLASSEGIGHVIVNGRQLFQLDVVMVGIFTIGLTGLAMDNVLGLLERRVLHWPRPALATLKHHPVPLAWRHAGFGVLLALLALWQLLAGHSSSAIATGATPLQVLHQGIASLHDGSLLQALGASFGRYLPGLLIGVSAGSLVGIALGWNRHIDRIVGPVLRFVRHVAIFAWLPLLTAWVGLGESAKIAFVAIATGLTMLVAVAGGMRATPPALLEVADVLGLSLWKRFTLLRWPAAAPQCFAGFHLCLIHGWLATIGAEYFLSSAPGIGSLMIGAEQAFRMDVVVTAMLTIGALGAAFNHTGRWLEQRATGWRHQGANA